jgi:hypothetical protein
MKATYRTWLEQQKYDPATVSVQIYRAERVEEYHGDLDQHYANDRMESLISTLRYTTDDKRRARPNPSKIPFEGDIRNNLASYRNSVERYRRFRDSGDDGSELTGTENEPVPAEENLEQRIGLERDIQAALRMKIEQLEPGLAIIDDGAERSVDSGFIDITARDASAAIVVIELKAGSAGQRAVAQILSYMGDVAAEDEKVKVRGILVAADFDKKARAAARMVPNLVLRRYSVRFHFCDGSA